MMSMAYIPPFSIASIVKFDQIHAGWIKTYCMLLEGLNATTFSLIYSEKFLLSASINNGWEETKFYTHSFTVNVKKGSGKHWKQKVAKK